jgi:hypothetical protein
MPENEANDSQEQQERGETKQEPEAPTHANEPRLLEIGMHRVTSVFCLDTPGAGGACHVYNIQGENGDMFATVIFQNGPVQEAGLNGCFQEDLLAIVIDRLEHFQRGPFACPENGEALLCVRVALNILNARTRDRQQRGVEWKNLK